MNSAALETAHTAGPEYLLSSEIFFHSGGNSLNYVKSGWHGPDEDFTWCAGDVSTLEIYAPLRGRPVQLTIELAPILAPQNGIASLSLKIEANGSEIYCADISRRSKIACEISSSSISADGRIELRLIHKQHVRPCDSNPKSTDPRPLSFAIFAMKFLCAKMVSDGDPISDYLRHERPDLLAMLEKRLWLPPVDTSAGRLTIDFSINGNSYEFLQDGWPYRGRHCVLAPASGVSLSIPLPILAGIMPIRIDLNTVIDPAAVENDEAQSIAIEVNNKIAFEGSLQKRTDVSCYSLLTDLALPRIDIRIRHLIKEGSSGAATRVPSAMVSGGIRLESMTISFSPPIHTLSGREEELALNLIDRLITACQLDLAISVLKAHWVVCSRRGPLIKRLVEIARIRCDVAAEIACLHWARASGEDLSFQIATNQSSYGRPYAAVLLLQELIAQRGNSPHVCYELALAYRNLGWYDFAVKWSAKVPDPHPYWAGPIKNMRTAYLAERTQARSIFRRYKVERASLPDREAVRLALILVRLGKLRAAKLVLSRFPLIPSEALARVETHIAFRMQGPAHALSLFKHIGENSAAESESKVLFGSLLTQLGMFQQAAEVYKNEHSMRPNDSWLANAAIGNCISGDYQAASKSWGAINDLAGLTNYVAQVVTSACAGLRKSPVFSLITEVAAPQARPSDTCYNIVQFWDDRQIPQDVADCVDTWRTLNPSATHHMFCEERARDFISAHYGSDTVICFDSCHHPAMKSDFFRILWLRKMGGLYVDADLVCVVPIAETLIGKWLSATNFIMFPLVPSFPYAANNDIIGVDAGNPILELMTEKILSTVSFNVKAGIKSDIGQVTGPGLLTKTLATAVIEANGLSDPPIEMIAIPFPYRRLIIASNNQLDYFKKKTHWSLV